MIFDIEANGLVDPTRIHVVSYEDHGGNIVSLTDYGDMRKFFLEATQLIGHNIMCYDIPVVEKLLGIKVDRNILVDTLPISWYVYPKRKRHGLELWGEELGIPKVSIDDWENLPVERYIERCEDDVRINSLLYKKQIRDLQRLYKDDKGVDKALDYLMLKMRCAALQEASRWKLDVNKVNEGLKELHNDKNERVRKLKEAMPQVPVTSPRKRPAKMYKQDGSLSAHGVKWKRILEDRQLPMDYAGVVKVTIDHEEPNPNSHPQIKNWLFSLGWKPDEFKHKFDENTRKFKEIPQINKQEPGQEGVTDSVRLLVDKEPAVDELDGLFIISHRISILEGFLKNVDKDGYVRAEVAGLTNTLRFKHRVCVNLPGITKPYGKLVRGCLTAPDGYELCGSDMASLEDRTKQHYMWPHDPGYVKEMQTEDFDPHLDIALEAGIMTQEEVDEYRKVGAHKAKRHQAKTTNYSCTYGSTPGGLVRKSGMSMLLATRLHTGYWKRNWSIQAIADECITKTCMGGMWLWNPVSEMWYSLRKEKDRFSTLNQGTGTYCFDIWIKHVLKRRPQLTAQFHDEGVWCLKKGFRDKFSKVLMEAIQDANDELGLNRELGIDIQYGDTYAQIH